MKVLIMDDDSGLYLAHQDRWTDDPATARDLSFSAHAAAVAKTIGLRHFQVFFYFAALNYKVSVFCSTQPAAAA